MRGVTRTLRFRTGTPTVSIELPEIDDETIGALKDRLHERNVPHPVYFVVKIDGRPLKVVERVAAVIAASGDGATFDVEWKTCSHGAPMHPITGESPCFWDGGGPSAPVEY